ncbi:small G protein signaling modulator 3, partial [Phenoliferia sp. Uapishka_3]
PHLLPADSPLLDSLPHEQLVALVRALSRDSSKNSEEKYKIGRVCEALATMLKDNGVGDGEMKRARVRARVDSGNLGKVEVKDWKIDLRDNVAERETLGVSSPDESAEIQTVLDLDDLAEAISENAFSFTSPSSFPDDLASPHSHATHNDDLMSDTDSISRHSTRSQNDSPVPPHATPTAAKTRQRHASLSSRIFNTFSIHSTSPPPPLPTNPSISSASSSLGVPHQEPQSASKKRHGRSDSVLSASSAASIASGASESGSVVERKESGSNYGEWMGWRAWSSSKGRDDASRKSTLATESVQDGSVRAESDAGDAVGDERCADEEVEEVTEGEDGEEQNETVSRSPSALNRSRRRRGSTASDASSSPRPGHEATVTENGALSSSVLSVRSHATTTHSSATDAPSSPTTSTSPPSSSTPDLKAVTSPASSPLLTRSRGPSIPLLTSQLSVAATASISTPTPTSTMSAASHLSATQLQSRKSPRAIARSGVQVVHPSHFTAVVLAASRFISGLPLEAEESVLLRPGVGERVRSSVDALLGNVAAAALQPKNSASISGAPDDGTRLDQECAIDNVEFEANEGGDTIKARRRSEPPFLSIPIPLYSAPASLPTQAKEKGYISSAKGTLGRVLGLGASTSSSLSMARSASDGIRKGIAANGVTGDSPNLTMFPKLSSLSRYTPFAQPALSTPSTHASLSSHSNITLSHSPSLPSVTSSAPTTMELDTISGEAAPPTLALHNPSTGRTAGEAEDGPMVDRYGFLYDVRSGMKLLREARKRQERALRGGVSEIEVLDEAQLRAAAALIEEATARDEEEEREQTQLEVDAELEALREALGLPSRSPTLSRSPVPRLGKLVEDPERQDSPSSSSTSFKSRAGSPAPSRDPKSPQPVRPARLIRSKSVDATPSPTGGPQSMKRLLSQLTEMHDAVEKTQKEAWEVFIARRQTKLRAAASEGGPLRRDRTRQSGGLNLLVNEATSPAVPNEMDLGWNENLVGVAQMGVAGKSGKEDWSEFKTLVRKGVPIAFRPKIWAECSGANEAREPGLYQELLSLHNGEENQCLNQIDMDCHRTFPTNVFFAGNGPGVAKLRNVLIAYSWRNPKIGYCQGMNNLTATLLLTHPAEEDAFWVLVCIIEKILPSDYYTSHLLVSQADQRVLRDLVQRIMPDVADHLEDLGVELPAITFGWFLSLFTDALPIQTLLRVWDLLFVFGTVILFRVAIATIQMNTQEILACDSAANLYALMRTMTTHLYQVDRLLKIACEDLRPVVKDRDISMLRNRHVAALQQELAIPDADSDS